MTSDISRVPYGGLPGHTQCPGDDFLIEMRKQTPRVDSIAVTQQSAGNFTLINTSS